MDSCCHIFLFRSIQHCLRKFTWNYGFQSGFVAFAFGHLQWIFPVLCYIAVCKCFRKTQFLCWVCGQCCRLLYSDSVPESSYRVPLFRVIACQMRKRCRWCICSINWHDECDGVTVCPHNHPYTRQHISRIAKIEMESHVGLYTAYIYAI